jgi:hypothetical protein
MVYADTLLSPDNDLYCEIEKLGYVIEGPSAVLTMTKLYPMMSGSSMVEIEMGSQQYAGGPVSWKPSQEFTPAVDRKLDVRSTGQFQCLNIRSRGEGTWLLGGLQIDYESAGEK